MSNVKKLLIVAVIFTELFVLKQWFLCKQFKDYIHFSSINLTLFLRDLSNNDSGVPLFFVRVFHNKIIVFLAILSKFYLRFWDVRFAVNLFSIIGYFGIILGIWYIFSRKFKYKKYLFGWFALLLVLPFVEIIFEPRMNFVFKIMLLSLPYLFFSLFGILQFIQGKRKLLRLIIVLVLIFLSVWWISVFQNDIYQYCIR